MLTLKSLIKKGLSTAFPFAEAAGVSNEPAWVAWIEKTLNSFPVSQKILDAGAGEQQFRKFCGHLEYVSQDFEQYNGQGDGSGLQTGNWDQTKLGIVVDTTAIPRPDASFDAIMCREAFEHLPDPIKAIREFFRLLKKDGRLLVTAPFCSLTHFAPFHFYSGFNRYFYETHLITNGFVIDEISTNGDYFEFLAQEVKRLCWASENYAKTKPYAIESIALKVVENFLGKLGTKDIGSSTILNFGMHVLARRV